MARFDPDASAVEAQLLDDIVAMNFEDILARNKAMVERIYSAVRRAEDEYAEAHGDSEQTGMQ